ncbi:MAG: pilin [Minisyncoccales bacterium]
MRKFILSLISISILILPFLVTAVVTPKGPTSNIDIPTLLDRIIDWAFYFLLIIAALFLVIAGFYFITAQGDAEQIKKAKNMVLYAAIGLVVAVVSRGIVAWLQTTIETAGGQ